MSAPVGGTSVFHVATGPVQRIVLGFDEPRFRAEVAAELERLRESDGVRVIESRIVGLTVEVLVEHEWVVPLREAIARVGGYRIADGFIGSLDLAEVGLVSEREAATCGELFAPRGVVRRRAR